MEREGVTPGHPVGWNEFFDPSIAGTGESGIPFLSVAHALAGQAGTVAEVGCGRGGWSELGGNPVPLQDFRGPNRTVIGIDLDPIGADNPMIDEFRQIGQSGAWPLENSSIDLAISDWVLEHVVDPSSFVRELTRVLAPGGVFVARTVSRHSPLSIVARAVPNDRHPRMLAMFQPDRDAKDVFPTAYRMNSERAIHDLFDEDYDWALSHRSDLCQYFRRWRRTSRAIAAAEPHLPKAVRSTLVLYARKRFAL